MYLFFLTWTLENELANVHVIMVIILRFSHQEGEKSVHIQTNALHSYKTSFYVLKQTR